MEKASPRVLGPIALLNYSGRVLEKVINLELLKEIELKKIYRRNKFGFRRSHSSEMSVRYLCDYLY